MRAVGVEESPQTRTRPVRFIPLFGETVKRLADGQSASLELPIGPPRTVLTVHKDAVIHGKGAPVVFVVEDGIAKMREIVLGEAVGPRFEVRAGLARGELVVVRGNERLTSGQPVALREAS